MVQKFEKSKPLQQALKTSLVSNKWSKTWSTTDMVLYYYFSFFLFHQASNFFWGLWAILQSQYSSIDFDFRRFVFLNEAAERSHEIERKGLFHVVTLTPQLEMCVWVSLCINIVPLS